MPSDNGTSLSGKTEDIPQINNLCVIGTALIDVDAKMKVRHNAMTTWLSNISGHYGDINNYASFYDNTPRKVAH